MDIRTGKHAHTHTHFGTMNRLIERIKLNVFLSTNVNRRFVAIDQIARKRATMAATLAIRILTPLIFAPLHKSV